MDIVQNQNNISPRRQVMLRKPKSSSRSSSRRAKTQDSVANVDEAKREFSLALQLHKSSLISSGTNSDHNPQYDNQCYLEKPNYKVYSLMEPIPLPGPIWSTTQPSVWALNNGSSSESSSNKDLLDLEFFYDDNQDQASSDTWWVGFLKSLDGKITASNVVDENCSYKKHQSKEYYGCELEEDTSNNIVTPCVVDIINATDNKSLFGTTDEWLSFPSAPEDEGHETTIFSSPLKDW